MKLKNKYKFHISVSLGSDTGVEKEYNIEADSEEEAVVRAENQLVNSCGLDRVIEIYKEKGLPHGYLPYYFIHSKNKLK